MSYTDDDRLFIALGCGVDKEFACGLYASDDMFLEALGKQLNPNTAFRNGFNNTALLLMEDDND